MWVRMSSLKLGQHQCWLIVASVSYVHGCNRYVWYQLTTYFFRMVRTTILSFIQIIINVFLPPRKYLVLWFALLSFSSSSLSLSWYLSFVQYVCVLLDPGPCGMSKSWGGDVPTSGSDHSVPTLLHLLLCSLLLNPPHPLILSSNVCPRGTTTTDPPPHPSTSALLSHGIIRPPGCPLSLSQNT